MRILVFTEKQLSDILSGCTADSDIKSAFMQAIVKGSADSLSGYFYDALTLYNHAYTDVTESGLSHLETLNTLSQGTRLWTKLGLSTAKMCVVDPVDLISVYHSCDVGHPDLYDDTANLLYIYNRANGVDMTDQVIDVIKHVVDAIESHYVYAKEDTTELKLLIGQKQGQLILGIM